MRVDKYEVSITCSICGKPITHTTEDGGGEKMGESIWSLIHPLFSYGEENHGR